MDEVSVDEVSVDEVSVDEVSVDEEAEDGEVALSVDDGSAADVSVEAAVWDSVVGSSCRWRTTVKNPAGEESLSAEAAAKRMARGSARNRR